MSWDQTISQEFPLPPQEGCFPSGGPQVIQLGPLSDEVPRILNNLPWSFASLQLAFRWRWSETFVWPRFSHWGGVGNIKYPWRRWENFMGGSVQFLKLRIWWHRGFLHALHALGKTTHWVWTLEEESCTLNFGVLNLLFPIADICFIPWFFSAGFGLSVELTVICCVYMPKKWHFTLGRLNTLIVSSAHSACLWDASSTVSEPFCHIRQPN